MTKNDAKEFKARFVVKVDVEIDAEEIETTECWIEVRAADLDELEGLIEQVVRRFKKQEGAESEEY